MIKVNAKAKVWNKYELCLVKPDGTKKEYVSHNLVLDNYYNYIVSNNRAVSFSVIGLGQGTTEVVASQTSLSNLRASYRASVTNQTTEVPVSRILTYTIPEGTLTGNISEIGLTDITGDTVVYTRSLVSDAEGNPITIEKGALDILTVRVTVFYTFEGSTELPYVMYVNRLNAAAALRDGEAILDTSIYFFTNKINEYIASNFGSPTVLSQTRSSGNIVSDLPNKTIRINGNIILAANGNGSMTVPEWAARMIGNSRFVIDVEESGVFTPYVYNNLSVGTGDGSTTAYDMPLAFYYPDDVEISVDGVFLEPEEYTVISQTISRSLRTLPSADLTKVIETGDIRSLAVVSGGPGEPGQYLEGFNYVCWDFGAPLNVSSVFLKTLPAYLGRVISATQVYLFKSDNGVDWEQVFYNAFGEISTTLTEYPLATPVSSRFYKLQWNQNHANAASGYDPVLAFGEPTKSITFVSPPGNGLPIVAKVTSRVPIKNSNFQLGASIQMKFERG